jgi:hypothetical protein
MSDETPEFLSLTPISPEPEPPEPEPAPGNTFQPPTPTPEITFQGNNYDLMAIIGVTIGAVTLLSCATCNMGVYCLPFAPLILGAIGLFTAKDSVNPERTKLLSWLSLGAGIVFLLLILVVIVLYGLLFLTPILTQDNFRFD